MEQHETLYSRDLCRAVSTALDAAADGVWVTDRQGGLLYQNAALRSLLTAEDDRRTVEETIADVRHASLARLEALYASGHGDGCLGGGLRTSTDGAPRGIDAHRPLISVQVRTSTLEYRVRGTIARFEEAGRSETMVVVWVRKCRPRQLTLDALRERYGLTPREVRVAALLAARSGSREIAEALGISRHTARRHAEAVLRKLGVHSRSEVAERLTA